MNIAITANCDKHEVRDLLPRVFEWLRARQVSFFVEDEVVEQLNLADSGIRRVQPADFRKNVDMVLSFGGDGTILSTARKVGDAGIPILGVKIGGMGFLAELAPDELYTSLPEILKGNFQVVERMVLTASIDGQPEEHFFALNDFVVDKAI